MATAADLSPAAVALAMPHTLAVEATGARWDFREHLKLIGREAKSAVASSHHLNVNLPPRHGKSELLSHWLPIWFLARHADKRVILASYGADLAEDFSRAIRERIRGSELLSGLIPIDRDSTSVQRWHTEAGGAVYAVGVGGPLSGRGGDLIILDDPYKNWQEAWSATYRRRVEQWFDSVLRTRAEPDATIVLVQTRWHPQDLSGRLADTEPDRWRRVVLPALAESDDPLGRDPGEPLWAERYDAEALARMQRASPSVFAALYQQRPEDAGGGRVYASFRSERNIDQGLTIRPDLTIQLSLDFNINPGMHGIVGQYDKAGDIATAVHELHGLRWSVRELMEAFVRLWPQIKPEGRAEIHLFGDASGNAQSVVTGQSSYSLVMDYLSRLDATVHVRVPRSSPPVLDRVAALNDALCDSRGQAHYLVHPRCERLIADFRELVADEQGLVDKSDQALSHASEAEHFRLWMLRPAGAGAIETMPSGRFSVSV